MRGSLIKVDAAHCTLGNETVERSSAAIEVIDSGLSWTRSALEGATSTKFFYQSVSFCILLVVFSSLSLAVVHLLAHFVVLLVGDSHVALLHQVGVDVHLLLNDTELLEGSVRLNLGFNVVLPTLHEPEEVAPSIQEQLEPFNLRIFLLLVIA